MRKQKLADPSNSISPSKVRPASAKAVSAMPHGGLRTGCACGGGCALCSTVTGAANDALEREADRAADTFIANPQSVTMANGIDGENGATSRHSHIIGRPTNVSSVSTGAGHMLAEATRLRAEAFFDADFSGVRIHDDGRAADSARDLSAHAYTADDHIAFAVGAYRPGTTAGDRLIAHELAHVMQQRRKAGPFRGMVQRQPTTPDFLSIAQRLHTAMDRLGTDESAIFTALGELHGDQQAGDELKRVYQNVHGQDLEVTLRDELEGADLTRAQGLLNPGGAITPLSASRLATLQAGVRSIARSGNATASLHQDPVSGKLSGYQLHQMFEAQFDPSASTSDYAIIQWIKGEMYETRGGNRVYWPASMGLFGRGASQPWRFTDWVIDTPDADPRFGSNRGTVISVPTTTFDDAPGVIMNSGTLPAGHHWEVDARVGIYPWGTGIPTFVAGWESIRPTPLVETNWGWTVEVDASQTSLNLTIR